MPMDAPRCGRADGSTRVAALTVVALLYGALVTALTGPGFASFDTAYQWWMARHMEISTLWPPAYVFSFRLLDGALPGLAAPTAWFVINLSLTSIGAALVALRCTRSVVGAMACYFALVASPVAWLLLPHVWSDVALVSMLLVAVGCLVAAETSGASGLVRRIYLAASFVGLFAAVGVRHNAIVAVVPLAVLWCALAMPEMTPARSSHAWRNRLRAIALGVLMSGVFVGVHAVAARMLAVQRADTWAITAIWDLQAMSVALQQNLIPKSISPDTDLVDLRESFDPSNAVTLYSKSRAHWVNSTTGLTPTQTSDLLAAWRQAAMAAPSRYLVHRWHAMAALLGMPGHVVAGTRVEPVQTQFKDNPPRTFWWPAGIDHWRRLALRLSSKWFCSPFATIALAVVFVVGALIRQYSHLLPTTSHTRTSQPRSKAESQRRLAVATGVSALLYLAGLFATVPTADMRYAFWPVVAFALTAVLISTTRSPVCSVTSSSVTMRAS